MASAAVSVHQALAQVRAVQALKAATSQALKAATVAEAPPPMAILEAVTVDSGLVITLDRELARVTELLRAMPLGPEKEREQKRATAILRRKARAALLGHAHNDAATRTTQTYTATLLSTKAWVGSTGPRPVRVPRWPEACHGVGKGNVPRPPPPRKWSAAEIGESVEGLLRRGRAAQEKRGQDRRFDAMRARKARSERQMQSRLRLLNNKQQVGHPLAWRPLRLLRPLGLARPLA